MEYASSPSSAEDMSAAVINAAVEEAGHQSVSYSSLAHSVETIASDVGVETPEVADYISALRTFTHDVTIGALPEGVGGQFDGSITIATNTVEVGSSGVMQTIAQMQEVYDHELYHALHHHTDAMMTWGGESNVVIAGQGFSTTDVIEGLTVAETGDEFVSQDYKNHRERLLSSIARAGISLDDVRAAVNRQKDLTLIDDRRRAGIHALAL